MEKKRISSRKLWKWIISFSIILAMVLNPVINSYAEMIYMTGVTEEMCHYSYWTEKKKDSKKLLLDMDGIEALNKQYEKAEGLGIYDLKNMPETVNGFDINDSLLTAAEGDKDYMSWWEKYDSAGNEIDNSYYDEILDNTQNPNASEEQNVGYGIVTSRTVMTCFPTDKAFKDDYDDDDFDNLYLTCLLVNDPLVIISTSKDGNYYWCYSKTVSGWVPSKDVAVCANKAEWLEAWDIDYEKVLVVYGDKVMTEESRNNPEISRRELTMGTVLRLADKQDWKISDKITNRSAYNNHVVWMPVRDEDGKYRKVLSLISQHTKTHEGYLPLTSENIAMVAFGMLGNVYGWGGMLGSVDCSGYIKDIYRCFGIYTSRDTKVNPPAKHYDVREADDETKQKLLDNMPIGTVLMWSAHEMMYIGEKDGKHYVINSVSSLVNSTDIGVQRVRGVTINSIEDTFRANGKSWISVIEDVVIPYIGVDNPLYEHDYYQDFEEEKEENKEEDKEKDKIEDNKEDKTENKTENNADNKIENKNEKQSDSKTEDKNDSQISNLINIKKSSYSLVQGNKKTIKLGVTSKGGKIEYFSNNKNVTVSNDGIVTIKKNFTGTAVIMVTASGTGYETAARDITINVKPKETSIKTLKSGKKSFTVTATKTENVSGYELQYSRSLKFAKTSTMSKYSSKNSFSVKNTKTAKTYYVRVRSYKVVKSGGIKMKLYSKWSKVKKVKL